MQVISACFSSVNESSDFMFSQMIIQAQAEAEAWVKELNLTHNTVRAKR